MRQATVEEKTIASVSMAGWLLTPIPSAIKGDDRILYYAVISPAGQLVGRRSTCYTAALLAEAFIYQHGDGWNWYTSLSSPCPAP